jgi:hypothetical protein
LKRTIGFGYAQPMVGNLLIDFCFVIPSGSLNFKCIE